MKNWMKLTISMFIPLAIGGIAGLLTTSEINGWFQSIKKPWWQPPNWVFGPVWAGLYLLMGVAFYLIWKSSVPAKQKGMAITLWIIQLVFNFFWSYIFFKKHQIDWALGEIVLLWVFILLTMLSFGRIRKTAAWLMVPYISWVTFATLLTLTIYRLN